MPGAIVVPPTDALRRPARRGGASSCTLSCAHDGDLTGPFVGGARLAHDEESRRQTLQLRAAPRRSRGEEGTGGHLRLAAIGIPAPYRLGGSRPPATHPGASERLAAGVEAKPANPLRASRRFAVPDRLRTSRLEAMTEAVNPARRSHRRAARARPRAARTNRSHQPISFRAGPGDLLPAAIDRSPVSVLRPFGDRFAPLTR